MLVFWHQQLTMLATPKTGTTAIESALESMAHLAIQRPPQLKHATVRKYHRFIGPWLESAAGRPFTVIATMREPLDWLGSWYRFRARDALIGHPNSTAHIPFARFVQDYLLPGQRPSHARLGRQSDFLVDNDNRNAVDHVFRYEAMPALLDFLATRLGQPITLPRANVSPPAATDLDPQTAATLREALAPEYAIWQAARQTP